MKGSEFVAAFRNRSAVEWETAAIDLARRGHQVAWPLLPLTLTDGVRTIVLRVACDYFAVGTPDDYLRLPMMPANAQRAADLFGMLLPTKKLSIEIWRQSVVKATPIPQAPNRGPDLEQYAAEDLATEAGLPRARPGIVAGHRKDIIVGRLLTPGKLVIFGWYWPDDPKIHGPYLTDNLRASQPIQPYSDAHGATYVDYSHGVRFVEGVCTVDGVKRPTAEVLSDPSVAMLLSDEGPLTAAQIRYNVGASPAKPADVPYELGAAIRTNPADRGLDVERSRAIDKREGT